MGRRGDEEGGEGGDQKRTRRDTGVRFIQPTWQQSDDLLHLLLKPNLQDPVCLVNDETLKVTVEKSLCVLGREGARRRGEYNGSLIK